MRLALSASYATDSERFARLPTQAPELMAFTLRHGAIGCDFERRRRVLERLRVITPACQSRSRHAWKPPFAVCPVTSANATSVVAHALDEALSFIREELARAQVTATEHPFEVSGRSFTNVEVIVPSRSGATERGCIVVGAHYDTVPGTPGADDNATGVAALLELARQLAHERFERSLRLVFFPNEEPPFFPDAGMGSAAYAAELRRAAVDVHTMISLEMLGYYSDRPHSQRYPPGLSLLYPNQGNFIGFVSNLRSRKRLQRAEARLHRQQRLSL